jgi:hypothetical protein
VNEPDVEGGAPCGSSGLPAVDHEPEWTEFRNWTESREAYGSRHTSDAKSPQAIVNPFSRPKKLKKVPTQGEGKYSPATVLNDA